MTTLLPLNLSSFGHNNSNNSSGSSKQHQQHQLLLLNRHFSSSKALPIRPKTSGSSSFSRSSHLTTFSISLPVLCLTDRGGTFAPGGSPISSSSFFLSSSPSVQAVTPNIAAAELPLKASGSLPDLYTMVSGSAPAGAKISPERLLLQNGSQLLALRDRASSLNATATVNSCSTSAAAVPEKVLPVDLSAADTAAAVSFPEPKEPTQADSVHFLSGISTEPLSSALFRSTQPDTAVAAADFSSSDKRENNSATQTSNLAEDVGKVMLEKVMASTIDQPTRKDSSSSMMSTSPSSTPGTPRRRKNSSMTPVLPDLELMAKLQAEDEQKEKEKQGEEVGVANEIIGGGAGAPEAAAVDRKEDASSSSEDLVDHRKEWQLFGSGSEKESAAAWLAAATKQRSPQTTRRKNGMHLHFGGGGGDDGDVTGLKFTSTGSTGISCGTEVQLAEKQSAAFPFPPVPTFSINKSSQYTPSFQSSSSLSSSSSPAPASRAIPTIVTTPPTTTTTNTFFSGIDSSTAQYQIPSNNNSSASVQTPQPQPPVSPKPLQPFGKNDRVRRTSILRPPASFVPSPAASVAAAKKKVSFADTAGKALEVVRYFSITPVATRRYSSYTAPTGDAYLTNGNYNSPWNFAISGNTNRGSSIRTSTGNGCSSAASTAAPAFSVSKEYDYSQHGKLAPRYELVACNFTSPSLQISFGQKLEAQSVLLHSVTTAETTVYGTVSVMNRHFTKRVLVRYTFNEWASYIEREATYMLGSHDGRTDKFSFVIYARPEDFGARAGSGIGGNQQQQHPNLATAFTAYSQANTFVANGSQSATSSHPRLYFALCFSTGDGRQYWDNNDGRNYCLNLTAY